MLLQLLSQLLLRNKTTNPATLNGSLEMECFICHLEFHEPHKMPFKEIVPSSNCNFDTSEVYIYIHLRCVTSYIYVYMGSLSQVNNNRILGVSPRPPYFKIAPI